tara:strand:+ start:1308 stop:1658 length:351 start_codon:yes stop_codon:yes gene_type:complete
MNELSVKILTRIICLDEESKNGFSVLLDDTGEIPRFNLVKDKDVNSQLVEFVSNFIHENHLHITLATKTVSSIEIEDDSLNISYNLISNNKITKSGKFVKFDKNSIELYRLANNIR